MVTLECEVIALGVHLGLWSSIFGLHFSTSLFHFPQLCLIAPHPSSLAVTPTFIIPIGCNVPCLSKLLGDRTVPSFNRFASLSSHLDFRSYLLFYHALNGTRFAFVAPNHIRSRPRHIRTILYSLIWPVFSPFPFVRLLCYCVKPYMGVSSEF